jgi:hypothetical protein
MTRLRKSDPEALRQEYVYADPPISITELADRHGLARSGVADKARIGHWFKDREEFRNKVTTDVTAALAEKWAEFQVANYERLMKVAADYLDTYQKELAEGTIKVNTRDMLGIAAMMRTFLSDMTKQPLDSGTTVIGPDGEEFSGTDAEARSVIEEVKRLMAGGKPDDAAE